jgi:flagellar basal body-associated protein FliL
MKRTTATKRDLVEVLNNMSLNDTTTGNQKKSLKQQLDDNATSILKNCSVDYIFPLNITYFKSIFLFTLIFF